VTIPRVGQAGGPPEQDQAPPPGFRPGAIVGSYRILSVLGAGGMGQVYLAEHIRLGRQVAVKRLRSDHASNPALVRRFFAEARAANRIHHENVIEISDFLETEQGDRCYVMELLRGQSLGDVLARDGVLPLPRTLAIAMQVCSALAAVHATDIVHRDLKPENIFLIERGRHKDFVKLIDFGIAKLSPGADSGPLNGDATGGIMGTPEYMAPEQACGAAVDQRTDIYALGVILYELCSGKKPFAAATLAELLEQHQSAAPIAPSAIRPLPPRVAGALDRLILSCLAKDPARRPPTMAEVEARLRGIARDLAAPPPALPPPRTNRRALLAPALVGLFLALVALGGYGWIRPPRAGAAVPAPESPASARVALVFESTPPGAVVVDALAQRPVGTTPLTLWVPRSDEVATYDILLFGRPAGTVEVPLSRDARVAVLLPPTGDFARPAAPVMLSAAPGPAERPPKRPAPARRPARAAPRPAPAVEGPPAPAPVARTPAAPTESPPAATPAELPPPPVAEAPPPPRRPAPPARTTPPPRPRSPHPTLGRGDVMDLDD
jgi:serine/threonine-protein kinase